MVSAEDLPFFFIQKEPLSGSCQGMRYYLVKEKDCITVWAYPDRFCFVRTPEEQKIRKEFPNQQESISLIVDWLNGLLADGSF